MFFTVDVFSTDDYLESEQRESATTEYVNSGRIVFRKTGNFTLESEADSPSYEQYRRMAIEAWYATTGNWRIETIKRLDADRDWGKRLIEMMREDVVCKTVLCPRELRIGYPGSPTGVQFYYSNDVESWLIVLSKPSAKKSTQKKIRKNPIAE